MLFLSGRIPERGISNKFYGLNKIEKISEKLLSTSEKIISNPENRIYEIEKIKKKININNIIKLAYGKLDNKKLKLKLDYMIKTNK
jgi:FlaA1/EpsC-like NDP-sugar epimerase